MAFATSQNIDQLLTRGLAFRLPNNAPISSLYTLYANGAGMTYWSNSMNPRDLSTVSSAYGVAVAELSNTVAFQQGEINDLYGQVSTLSTSISSLSNWMFDYTNSTIAGLSTFSTFYNDLYSFSNATGGTLSTLSTSIYASNSTTTAFFISSLTSTSTRQQSSIGSLFGGQASTTSSVVALNRALLSTSGVLQRILFSTSAGLTNYINVTSSSVSTFTNQALISTFSTTNNLYSTIQGYAPRLSSLEGMSTNQSTVTGVWISSQVGVSQSTQNALLISSFYNLSTFISTVAVYAVGQANQISSLSTSLFGYISTNNEINATQNGAISTLARNLSILTTSSILAGVYDTFMQLEAYTVNLINSTVYSMNYWQSSLYASTILQTQAIGGAYFSTFNATAYYSTVSAVTMATNAYASTLTSTSVGTLYSTSYTSIVNLNSTQISLVYSTGLSYIISTLPQYNALSTIAIGSNAGSTLQGTWGIAIGYNAGFNTQAQNGIAIGQEAGLSNQLIGAVAIGLQAGRISQGSHGTAVGIVAGKTNQGTNATAVGNAAGFNTQGLSAVAVGDSAGQTTQGNYAVAVGVQAGNYAQGAFAVAIGNGAGNDIQGSEAVAIGDSAGIESQGTGAVAIGYNAGGNVQGNYAVAIGQSAGSDTQGNYAIAIGYQAATTTQTANSIVLNASGSALETGGTAGMFINPVRNDESVTAGFVHYNTATKELVYNSVGGGGGGGGGGTSTFNDLLFSTARGLQVSAVNVNGIETAKTNRYDNAFVGNTITLVSTLNGGDTEQEGRWAAGPVAMSADGKYQLFGTGIDNSILKYYTYKSSNYGESYARVAGLGGCNWNGFAMSRSGQYMYTACGGDNTSQGTLFKSVDFGETWSSLASIPTGVWGAVACSGDGRMILAIQQLYNQQLYISRDFGQTFNPYNTSNYYIASAVSLTGQYMTVCKAVYATGISISSDYGQTWQSGSGSALGFACLAMSADGKYQVAGHADNGTLYSSSNYGSNWSLTNATGLSGTVYAVNMDDSGQYVTAAVFNNGDPNLGGIFYSSNYGVDYQILTRGLNFLGCGISPNAQYMTFLARPSIYRAYIPTLFGAGISVKNYSPSTNTAYFVNSNVGLVAAGNSSTWNSVIGLGSASNTTGQLRSWEIGLETADSTSLSLGFLSYDTNNFSGIRTLRGYVSPDVSNVQMNFTGQHRCFPADDTLYPLTSNIGKVVIATGQYQSMPINGSLVRGISSITIAESLPLISLSTRAKDKRCFGIICDVEEFDNRTSLNGNFVTPYVKTPGDTRIFVNSIGEGAIWVCDANGPVENGDYLTTSELPGYAMKQGEEYIANYTVGKATTSCDFEPHMLPAQKPLTSTINGQTIYILDQYSTVRWTLGSNLEPLYQLRYLDMYGQTVSKETYETILANGGVAHRAAFIGCTYHCG